jgi:hypothetical protein
MDFCRVSVWVGWLDWNLLGPPERDGGGGGAFSFWGAHSRHWMLYSQGQRIYGSLQSISLHKQTPSNIQLPTSRHSHTKKTPQPHSRPSKSEDIPFSSSATAAETSSCTEKRIQTKSKYCFLFSVRRETKLYTHNPIHHEMHAVSS